MTPYRKDIETAAVAHGLDPDLLQAVVEQESSYRFYAYRYEPAFFRRYLANHPDYKDRIPEEVSASYGFCQVMFSTAREYGYTGEPWGLFSPTVNLDIGARVLAKLLKWARTHYQGLASKAEQTILRSALAAYNGGKGGNAPDDTPDRNREYAHQVITRFERIRKERG
jgi:soluble lytic murein transglycosylase-like protein